MPQDTTAKQKNTGLFNTLLNRILSIDPPEPPYSKFNRPPLSDPALERAVISLEDELPQLRRTKINRQYYPGRFLGYVHSMKDPNQININAATLPLLSDPEITDLIVHELAHLAQEPRTVNPFTPTFWRQVMRDFREDPFVQPEYDAYKAVKEYRARRNELPAPTSGPVYTSDLRRRLGVLVPGSTASITPLTEEQQTVRRIKR